MSIPLTINGVSYEYPETNDQRWGPDATQWASAVTTGMLQKAGGLFQLLAEVDFGTTYGVKSVYYKSRTASPASAGQIRLAKTDTIKFRNDNDDGDIALAVGSSDLFASYAGIDLVNASSAQNISNKTFTDTTFTSPILITPTIQGNADSDGYYIDVLNVIHYGAVGNGIADDTTAFQDALDYAGSVGGSIYVPAGTYKITADLVWPDASNVSLVGSGAGQSIIRFAYGGSPSTTAHGILIASMSSLSHVAIKDLSLEGIATDDTTIYDLIYIGDGVSDFSLENCELSKSRHAGVHVAQSVRTERAFITNNYFHDINSAGVTVTSGAALEHIMNHSEIVGNTFKDCGSHSSFQAIYLTAVEGVAVTGNTFTGTYTTLQIFDGSNKNISITGNTFNGGAVVYLFDMLGSVFSSNSLYNTTVDVGSNNLQIVNNYFYKTTNDGFALITGNNYTGAVIAGNTFVNTGTSNIAIYVDPTYTTTSGWTISDNVFLNWTKSISLYGTSHVVKNNQITSTSTAEQIELLSGTGHYVFNNYIKGGSSGVAIANGSGASQVVRGNIILNSGTISAGSGLTGSYLERDGSVSLPTYSFWASPDTGAYSPSSQNWAVATAGTIALRINNSQQSTFSAQVTLPTLISATANPASAGTIRLANADTIKFRNALNDGDLSFTVGSTNAVPSYGAIDLVNLSTSQTLTNKTIAAGSNTISGIVNANIDAAAGIDFSKLATLTSANILVGSSGNVATSTAVTGDIAITNGGVTSISSGVIVNGDINASAAIDFSKLATLTSANILVGSAGNVATSTAVTGDIAITNGGVTSIASGVIINTDINASAAIDFSKLATLTSGNILVGSVGNVATSVAMSSEASIIASGAVTLANSAVIGKVLTGYSSGAGTVASTDTILQAINKLNGNDALKLPLAGGTLTGPLLLSSGASGALSVQFSAETSLGFYRSSTGSIIYEGNQSGGIQTLFTNLHTSGDTKVAVISAAGGSGDAFINFRESGDGANTGWSIGRDDSDSAAFCIGSKENGTLGTNNVVRMTTGGAVAFPQVTTTASAANAFLDSGSTPVNNLLRSTSSQRYKKNIEDMNLDSEMIYKLRPVEFDDKTLGSHHFGLVAEEVAEVCPMLVNYANETLLDPKGDPNKKVPDGVQYQLLGVLLLKELKKLKDEIEELKKAQ